jgi:hypothetical protein
MGADNEKLYSFFRWCLLTLDSGANLEDRYGCFQGAIAKVRELGGDALVGPIGVPAGRISVPRDPQGATFAIFEGETDD